MLKADWLGARNGGQGHFIKYCPCCNEKVYLMHGSEFDRFLVAVKAYRLQLNVAHYIRRRLHLPKLKLDWE